MHLKKTCLSLFVSFFIAACGGGGGGGSSSPSASTTPASTSNSVAPTTATNPASTNTNPQPPAPQTNGVEIKLLALYTPGVADQFSQPDVRIAHLVNVANDVMAGSGVDIEFSLAHIQQVSYPDDTSAPTALDALTFATDMAFEQVAELRNTAAADLVVLFKPYANDGFCGYAWIGGFGTQGDFSNPAEADFGYSVVSSNCSDYTLVHELGHNLGLGHSRRENSDGGTFDYAVGFGMDQDFVTIMASPTAFNATQLPKLSSPDLVCNDQPCGIVHTDASAGSDAVRAVNMSKMAVSQYRE